MPPTEKAVYNLDWLLSDTSNIHMATSKDWFDTYADLTSFVVSIPVRPYRNKPGSDIITLSGVLHVPNASANVISIPLIKEDFQIEGCRPGWQGDWMKQKEGDGVEWKGGWIRNKPTAGGRKLALVEARWLPKLRLKGQQFGYTSLKDTSKPFEGLQWPLSEVERWGKESGERVRTGVIEAAGPEENESLEEEADSQEEPGREEAATFGGQGRPPFTYKERRWLEGNYGGEDAFKQKYNITDQDRVRRIARYIMMVKDEDEDITEGRIKARALLERYQETRNRAEAASLERHLGLARMMLSNAAENMSIEIEQ